MKLTDDGASELRSFPFAPGASPFRIKGVAYRGHLEYVEANVPGGVPGMLEDLGDPRLREFFQQNFLAASFYDVVPLAIAGIVCGARTGQTFLEFVRTRTQAQARSDVRGVYRVLLALTSAEAVALRIPKLVGQYLDFGDIETKSRSKGLVTGTRTGVPRALAPWYITVSDAYLRVVLSLAGGGDPSFAVTEVRDAGERDGIQLVDFDFAIRWR